MPRSARTHQIPRERGLLRRDNQDAILTHCDRWDIFLPSSHLPIPHLRRCLPPSPPTTPTSWDTWEHPIRSLASISPERSKATRSRGRLSLPTQRQLGSVHLAPGGRNESIDSHLPGQSSPFRYQDGRGVRTWGEMSTKR